MAPAWLEGILWARVQASSRRIQKKWLRATLTLVALLILFVFPSTSQAMGPGGVLAIAFAVALPPFLPLSVHMLLMFSFAFSVLASWGWVCAATAAANGARSVELLIKQAEEAEGSYVPGIPRTLQIQELIFSGHFLDPRSTVVYGVFFFIGTFFFALGVGYIPTLSFGLYMALTLMCSILSINPLTPYPSYLGYNTILISAGVYITVSTVSLLVIFPESYNHAWLGRVREDIMLPIVEFMDYRKSDVKRKPAPAPLSDLDSVMAMYDGEKGMFNLEFSIHRLSADEFLIFYGHIKQLVYRLKNIEKYQDWLEDVFKVDDALEKSLDVDSSDISTATQVQHYLNQRLVQLADGLRNACQVSLSDIDEWMMNCSRDSWLDAIFPVNKRKAEYRRVMLEISRSTLRKARAKFRKDGFADLLASDPSSPSKQGSESEANREDGCSALALSLMDNIDCLANELKSLLTFIIEIEAREPKPMPRLPGFFRKRKQEKSEKQLPPTPAPSFFPPKTSTYRDVRLPAMSRSLGDSSSSPSEKSSSSQHPSGLPYPSNFSPARKNTRVIAWFVAPQTIFAFRVAFLTLVFYVFGVSKKTTKFYMENNGMFALLLGQSYIAIYAGDQVFHFFVRFSATLLGLFLTLIGWHIEAGRGQWSPYSFVILTTILAIPTLLVVISTKKMTYLLFAALLSVTIVVTTGLIWGQAHATPGTTISFDAVFKILWERVLVDIIGFVVAAVFMMLPFPITARRGFHDKLSEALIEVGTMVQNEPSGRFPQASDRTTVIESTQERLGGLLYSMKFDPRLRSVPIPTYRQILEKQKLLASSVAHYIDAIERLDPKIRSSLANMVPCLNPGMVDRVQYRIVHLTTGIYEGQTMKPSGIKLREEVLRATAERHLDMHELSRRRQHDAHNDPLLFLPRSIPDTHLLILSSAVSNFVNVLDSIDDMGSLFASMAPPASQEESYTGYISAQLV
ncbi:hypothetical protein M413DRAFT_29592 [Hebeloma cylindrosporum]|uniref:Putative ER transporter 6TM N-terminal domain-containing protein n=1 Tax=Hebeloma cylindrosporum TaxID=76867 RepID=A0A0C2XMV2_HEBCY|nr:hypothetical protein M413DRAFT_29592 [Hebeloma cylindrosporum h7]